VNKDGRGRRGGGEDERAGTHVPAWMRCRWSNGGATGGPLEHAINTPATARLRMAGGQGAAAALPEGPPAAPLAPSRGTRAGGWATRRGRPAGTGVPPHATAATAASHAADARQRVAAGMAPLVPPLDGHAVRASPMRCRSGRAGAARGAWPRHGIPLPRRRHERAPSGDRGAVRPLLGHGDRGSGWPGTRPPARWGGTQAGGRRRRQRVHHCPGPRRHRRGPPPPPAPDAAAGSSWRGRGAATLGAGRGPRDGVAVGCQDAEAEQRALLRSRFRDGGEWGGSEGPVWERGVDKTWGGGDAGAGSGGDRDAVVAGRRGAAWHTERGGRGWPCATSSAELIRRVCDARVGRFFSSHTVWYFD